MARLVEVRLAACCKRSLYEFTRPCCKLAYRELFRKLDKVESSKCNLSCRARFLVDSGHTDTHTHKGSEQLDCVQWVGRTALVSVCLFATAAVWACSKCLL
eukprot:1155635-Pelagomonas_calceolata.AAC.19